ncbi:LysR substrate-binding domain-containing protein [Sphingobium sp. SA2]|uniref:LysR family transcriptional regulator n=1 Tax=Sphingobium sp. SA2 TaxID=1524832 RepID=UPI0028BFC836|nr:LysR substrate-binding domain-containing protein [Sphingobium sp. SA2]MDT7532009.1 LysR substrate-binding domain-containing protein [Sphingobium sp. SA2]
MDKQDQLRGIVEFVSAAQGGSFSAAARSMGVSVAHVSRAVRDLEQQIGVQLIQRNTRKSSLTDAGRSFFDKCRNILEELTEARERLQTGQHAVRGPIRISMNGYFAESRIAPALAAFAVQHPDILMEVEMNSRNVALIDEGFDLAVRAGPLETSALIARKLAGFPIITLAAPALLARVGYPDHPGLLDPAICLPLGERLWTFRRGGEEYAITAAGTFRSNSGALLVTAGIAGNGVIRLPSYYGAAEIEGGSLVPILTDWSDPKGDFEFHLVYPAQRHLPHRIRILIDYLVQECGRQQMFEQAIE